MAPEACLEERLSVYLDGGLSAEDRRSIDEHVRSCGRCRSVLEDLLEIRRVVHEGMPARPAQDPWPAIARAIGRRGRTERLWLRWAAAILLPLALAAAYWLGTARRDTSAAADALQRETAALQVRFDEQAGRLDPETAQAIRDSLAALDRALATAEQELDADRDNALVAALVDRAREQKLRLLQSVVSM